MPDGLDNEISRRIAELELKKMRRQEKADNKKKAAAATNKTPKKAAPEDTSDVAVADHLSAWKVLYHAAWSGEIEKFRNGVLTDAQANLIMLTALLLPLLGSGGTMLVMFAQVKLLTAGNWRTDSVTCVACTLLKYPLNQMMSDESPIWQQFGGDLGFAHFLLFLLTAGAVLSWAHVSLSSGGERWQLDHGVKFGGLLGVFALVHNPVAAAIWQPPLLALLKSALAGDKS